MARKVQYRLADGSLSSDRSDAITVSPDDIRAAVSGSVVPSQYFVGTAKHETDFAINEVDTEPNGHVTYGLFQIDDGSGDWWTFQDAIQKFVAIAESNATWLADGTPLDQVRRDFWAFLAGVHNIGRASYFPPDYAKEPFDTFIENNLQYSIDHSDAKSPPEYWESLRRYGNDCIPFDAVSERGSAVAFLFLVGTMAIVFLAAGA